MSATLIRGPKEHIVGKIMEGAVDLVLYDYGWGLVAEGAMNEAQRRLHLVTDGSVIGSATAFDAESKALLPQVYTRSEASIEIDGRCRHAGDVQRMGIEVCRWLWAIRRFLTTGQYDEAVDWDMIPLAEELADDSPTS